MVLVPALILPPCSVPLGKRMLIQTLSETADGPREDQQTQNQQGRKLRPQDFKSRSFKKNTSNDHQKIPQGVQIGEPLHHRGHIGNRKDKPGEHKKWQNEKKVGHHGLLLGLGNRGNKQPDAQCTEQEKTGGAHQQQGTSLHGNFKPQNPKSDDHDHLCLGNEDKGNRFA